MLENAVSTTFTLDFSSATHSAGTAYISVGSASTAAHPADYNSTLFVGSLIEVPFAANAPTATFTTTIVNDALLEPAEYALFKLDSVSTGSGIAVGSVFEATLVISDVATVPALFSPGDLVIVGVNANNFACNGGLDYDEISFFCFKDITPNTKLILTDNGYERCSATKWANSEGTVEITRTGPSIPAGQVITLTITSSSGSGNIVAVAPDGAWTCASLNFPSGLNTTMQYNSNGDRGLHHAGWHLDQRDERNTQCHI
ncbi:MAG: hypothetical protein IPN44_04010 [Flavobacteriales bacterium]|nr:hypothetical protein [Flavobacteriales bacterium]